MSDLTLATPANMRRWEQENPSRTVETPDGPAIIEPQRCIAVSLYGPDECSASSGDYFMLADDEPILDSDGEPMVLVVRETRLYDAFTGELL